MQFLNPTFLLAVLVALTVHEFAHALIAYRLGDHTAKAAGRLTLNPVAHLDPLGTLLFFLIGFGWGKPVPVNPYYFKHPLRDNALTAFAGPLSNFIIAFICFFSLVALGALSGSSENAWGLLTSDYTGTNVGMKFAVDFLSVSVFVNLGLMAFNLLPIAPLDGSKILQMFIPARYELEYENIMNYGPYILLGLLLMGSFFAIDLLQIWIVTIMNLVLRLFVMVL